MIEMLFFAVSAAELVMGVLSQCNVTLPFSRYILWCFFVVYIIVMLKGHYSYKEKLVLVGLLIIGTILYMKTGLNMGIKAPVYIYALKNVDIRKYYQISLLTLIVSFCVIVFASVIAGFGNLYMVDKRPYRGVNGLRYCLGFSNPNKPMAIILMMMLIFLYLYGEKIKWYIYVVIAGIYSLFYYLTDCKTAFILGILILTLSFGTGFVKWKGWSRSLFVLLLVALFIMLSISLLAAFHLQNSWIEKIDMFISGRMNQMEKRNGGENYLLPYVKNWRLFGTRLNKNVYDLGYVQIFYYYGIIPALCHLFFVVYSAFMAWKNRKPISLVILLGFTGYLFMESMYFSNYIPFNFLLIYCAVIMYDKSQCEVRRNTCKIK